MPDETEEFDFADYEVEVEEEVDVSEEESEEKEDESVEEEPQAQETVQSTTLPIENLEIEPLSQDAMTLTVSLEVGRIKLSLEKLLELQEGNLLEFDAKLDQPIDLVVGERCIGRGELIKVGDSLGVRILEMA